MAIRNDFTINWDTSPRVVIIDAPSIECTMQDLLDTLRWEESRPSAMDDAPLVSASGKEPLGGGTKVGITVSLQNTIVGFEARTGPDWVACDLNGGNLVAFDTDGSTVIYPLQPTAFVAISKTSSASATLQEQDALNYASYGGMVSVDPTSSNVGTAYPAGNQEFPVNNFTDALAIATAKGFEKVGVRKTMPLTGGDFSEFEIMGRSHTGVKVLISDLADVTDVVLRTLTLEGELDGGTSVWTCILDGTLNYFNGHIHESGLNGHIVLGGGAKALFADCFQVDVEQTPSIDLGGSGQDLTMIEYSGLVVLSNSTSSTTSIGIGLSAGQIVLDTATMTAGFIHVSGSGRLVDENGVRIKTGAWNGMTVINELTNKELYAEAVWESAEAEIVKKMIYNKVVMAGDIATIYEDNGTDVWKTFDLANDGRIEL